MQLGFNLWGWEWCTVCPRPKPEFHPGTLGAAVLEPLLGCCEVPALEPSNCENAALKPLNLGTV